ncbi:folate-binding protein [Acetobacter sp. TBRC 12305]|uniref:Folate-binding protein YgfZ n=1 Tax=Acetobacter garciniae TaxID=2817435 RepID=A0A939KN31_9PROT|nr:folate-binding protein YgfZ [Acetobacter garciniae]MBO1325943.1 folate-binding protein YgfZ [Acetobacter garciniae]MBX0345843.1 folate-binding protein [Acetobacter garciniae]
MSAPAPIAKAHVAPLGNRAVLKLAGADRIRFLQGLVTADIATLEPGRAAWSACLTPQGRWQADFFVTADPDETCLLLDCAASQAEQLRTLLLRFRLRADVQLELTGLSVYAAWGNDPDSAILENAISFRDPRVEDAGWRLIDPAPDTPTNASALDYDLHRLLLGLPDGVQDCEPGRTLPAEANMDLLGGISWQKGCFLGQEVTARMHYRTLLKRRMVPIASSHPLPAPGTPITHDGQEVGMLRSSHDHVGLALLKVEAAEKPLQCNGHALTARPPAWLAPALKPADKAPPESTSPPE